jgi:UDP-N-acetylmuramate--alanine ligase
MTHPSARFIASLEGISRFLFDNLHRGDVVLVLSAGDADSISKEVLTMIQKR